MAISQSFNYTWDGQVATDVIIKPVVQSPDFLSFFNVKTGIKNKWQITLGTAMTNVIKKATNCDARTASGTGTLSNRTLTLDEMEVFISACKSEFENNFTEEWLKTGNDINDLSGTDAETLILNLLTPALKQDLSRLFWFGNTGSANANLNGMTGVWTRLFAGVQDSYCVKRVDNIATLNQTAGTRAVDYFENAFTQAPIILKQIEATRKKFFVTGNLWENYLKYLESTDSNANGVRLLVDGQVTLFYRGIEVVPMYCWDNDIAAYSLGTPSRLIYTTPENHWIGVSAAADIDGISAWYEKKDRTYYIENQFKLGYQYAHCDLQVVSYGAAS
jgi:hypothetical protein